VSLFKNLITVEAKREQNQVIGIHTTMANVLVKMLQVAAPIIHQTIVRT
jgi:hypothetical protein